MTRFKPFEDEVEEDEGGRAVPDSNQEGIFCLGISIVVVIFMILAFIGAAIYDTSPLHSTYAEIVGFEVIAALVGVSLLWCAICTCTGKLDDSPMWVMWLGTFIVICGLMFIAAVLSLDSGTLAADVGLLALVVSFCVCFCYAKVLIAYNPGRNRNKAWPRAKRDKWGSIAAQVNLPAQNVQPADTWLSVLFMWATLPISLVLGAVSLCSPGVYRAFALSAKGSSRRGRPLADAPLWWSYAMMSLFNLARSGGSRWVMWFNLRKLFGDGTWFWQNEGAWSCTHKRVDEVLRSNQKREMAFAATTAVVPELFPKGILIFLSNYIAKTKGEISEWQDLRAMVHTHFLSSDLEAYNRRVALLDDRIAGDWPEPSKNKKGLRDSTLTTRLVAKSVFFVAFGIWITDQEADVLTAWKKVTALFALPRMVHRFMLNIGLVRMQALREETVALVRKYKLESVFFQANDSLNPRYQRATVVELADELMFLFCFAGVIGTSTGLRSVVAALQGELLDVPSEHVKFEQEPPALLSLYRQNPEAFIKEALRLDPPVTSGTAVLRDDMDDKSAKGVGHVTKGAYEQYVISLANRDPAVFAAPDTFNPQRKDLDDALTFNGKAFHPDEAKYPRICPGRHLAVAIIRKIVDYGLRNEQPTA